MTKLEEIYRNRHRKNYGQALDAEFKESDHPRDESGKFGSGGGGKAKTRENVNFYLAGAIKKAAEPARINKDRKTLYRNLKIDHEKTAANLRKELANPKTRKVDKKKEQLKAVEAELAEVNAELKKLGE